MLQFAVRLMDLSYSDMGCTIGSPTKIRLEEDCQGENLSMIPTPWHKKYQPIYIEFNYVWQQLLSVLCILKENWKLRGSTSSNKDTTCCSLDITKLWTHYSYKRFSKARSRTSFIQYTQCWVLKKHVRMQVSV